jgi:hypothetical protein
MANVDPTKDVMNLPKVREAGISWFRLHLHLDSSLIKQTLTLVVNQTVASEIYLNGRLLRRLGKVKPTSQKAEAQFTTLTQISFQADNRSQQLLAVRVAFEEGIPYQKLGGVWNQNHLLQIYLLKESDIDELPLAKMIRNSILIDSFKGGLFFIMFFLHLAFFAFYPLRKSNLFFAATTLCFSLDA